LAGAAGNAVGEASNVIDLASDYLGQVGAVTSRLFGGWYTAVPRPIPGAPQCATDQFSSALCAIWYIVQYTILDGAVGQQLVPLACRILELATLLRFIALGRAILTRLGKLTQIG
jgi:hypothetical protein